MTPAPERIERDGEWTPVDVTLTADGRQVTAKAHPEGLTLASGGGEVPASLAAAARAEPQDLVTLGTGSDQITLRWKGGLPKPELNGTTAIYNDALPNADVIVEATRTGFEQYVRLNERPQSGAYSYTLPLQIDGLRAAEQEDGSVLFTDDAGEARAVMPAPVMWDATVDEQSGEHLNRHTVAMEVVDNGAGDIDLVVTPDARFLADPDTTYPVTVDPSTSALASTFDTYVQQGETVDLSTDTELDFGNPGTTNSDGTPRTARSFIHWNTRPIQDALISSATLQLYNFHSGNTGCAAQGWRVWATSVAGTGSRWTNQPDWLQQYASSTETRGNPSCTSAPDGWISADVTNLVQFWASQQVTRGFMGLRAASDSSQAWKRGNSGNSATNQPRLSVTYNHRPQTGTDQQAGPPFTASGGIWQADTLSPTLRATFDDFNGDEVNGTFQIRNAATQESVGDYLVSDWTPAGQPAEVTVPEGWLEEGVTYEFRTSPYDGTHYNLGWSDWTPFTVVGPGSRDHVVDITLPEPDPSAPIPSMTGGDPVEADRLLPVASRSRQGESCVAAESGGRICYEVGGELDLSPAAEERLAAIDPLVAWCPDVEDGDEDWFTRTEACINTVTALRVIFLDTNDAQIGVGTWATRLEIKLDPQSGTFTQQMTFVPVSYVSNRPDEMLGTVSLNFIEFCNPVGSCDTGEEDWDGLNTWNTVANDLHTATVTVEHTWTETEDEDYLNLSWEIWGTSSLTPLIANADLGSTLGDLTIRCDSVARATPGCVFYEYTPTWVFNSASYPAAAAHVWLIQQKLSNHPGSREHDSPLHYLPDAARNQHGRSPDENRRVICPTGWAGNHGHPDTTPLPEMRPDDTASCDEYAFASTYESAGMPTEMDGTNPVASGNECVQTYATRVEPGTWKLYDDERHPAPTWEEVCGRSSMSLWQNSGSMNLFGLQFTTNVRLLDEDPYWVEAPGFDHCDTSADIVRCEFRLPDS